MEKQGTIVAIVDDDDAVRRALGRLVRSLSYLPVAFRSGEDFLASLSGRRPACAILDQHMPGMRGLDVLRLMRARGCDIPAVIITGLDQPGMSTRCIEAGASAYLTKPLDRSTIRAAIDRAIGS